MLEALYGTTLNKTLDRKGKGIRSAMKIITIYSEKMCRRNKEHSDKTKIDEIKYVPRKNRGREQERGEYRET